MIFYSTLFNYIMLIAVPLYCLYRFKKKSQLVLFNPCFYLLIAAYLYLTVPGIFLVQYIQWIKIPYYLRFKAESLQATNILCNWYVLVFLVFYIKSIDWKVIVRDNYRPKAITYRLALLFAVSLSIYFLYILLKYGTLLSSLDRMAALEFYSRTILVKYKVLILLPVFQGAIAVIIWRTRDFRWYLLLGIPILTEFLIRGRTRSLMILVFAYINYVAISRKTFAKPLIILLFSYIMFIPIYRSYEDFDGFKLILELPQILLFKGLAEIFATRITTVIAYEELMYSEDIMNYFIVSLLRLLPFFIYRFLLGENVDPTQVDYTSIMYKYYSQYYGINWGLAGNITTEALVYGGIEFAILSPLIIGGIFWILNRVKIQEKFPGFIFLCFLISQLQRIIRSSFYDSFIILIYSMFTYLSWIVFLERGRTVLWNSKAK